MASASIPSIARESTLVYIGLRDGEHAAFISVLFFTMCRGSFIISHLRIPKEMVNKTMMLRLVKCVVLIWCAITLFVGVANSKVWFQNSPPTPSTVAAGAVLIVVFADDRYFEGPSWDPLGNRLFFTAFGKGNEQVLRLDAPGKVTVMMDHTQGINGTYFSRDGRLLAAQAFGHNLFSMKMGADGPEDTKVLASGFEGIPFIQPNDVAESPVTGGIYFSDPNFKGKTHSAVYYLSREGFVRRVIDNLKLPNGLEVSNDGTTLYVSDSFEKRVYSYPITPDGGVDQSQVKIFFDPATENTADPDGMCADALGNLYFAMRGGVWVVSKEGKSLGLIPISEFASNVTFGGTDGQTLYITCDKKVYSLAMRVKGAQFINRK